MRQRSVCGAFFGSVVGSGLGASVDVTDGRKSLREVDHFGDLTTKYDKSSGNRTDGLA
jgi:hypothetical protein